MIPNIAKVLLLSSLILHHSHTAPCSNVIPGISKMVKGVDITILDLTPLDGIIPHGFKSPILESVCSRRRTWTNPTTKLSYQIPDQVRTVTTIRGGYSKADIQVINSPWDLRKKMNFGVNVGGGYSDYAFAASLSYENMQNIVINSSRKIEDVTSSKSAIRVLWNHPSIDHPLLDSFAKEYIDNKLKGTYQTNTKVYDKFIELFGTHYFTQAYFGGKIRSYMETDNNYINTKSDDEIETEAQLSFNSLLTSSAAVVCFDKGNQSASPQFTSSTSTSIKYYGGITNLVEKDGMDTWKMSVIKEPWLISGHLVPIYELVKDETKRVNLKTATDQYVQRAYLKELLRIVISAKLKYFHPILDDLYKRINTQLELNILDLSEVAALKKDTEYNFIVPEWFTKHTQLCFQYRAENSGNLQCNGRGDTLPETFCALPNSYTQHYDDNTSTWPGGCVMQWSIVSQLPPKWFLQTQICFKWEAVGAHFGQCNNAAIGEICAQVNEITSEYIEDTQYKNDFCKLSWQLRLPHKAPLWLQRSELCLHWNPQWDASQCGHGSSSQNLCASPGVWTEWYEDNTQHRLSGGCYLSWAWNIIQ